MPHLVLPSWAVAFKTLPRCLSSINMADTKETNGHSATNGQNSSGHGSAGASKRTTAKQPVLNHGPLGKPSKPNKKPGTIGNLRVLRKASQRPLPTEIGDGSYHQIVKRPTLRQDLKSFSKNGRWR